MSLRKRAFHLWFLVSRPLTMGARAIVLNDADEILLVRHTYIDGWHLPGGGIEPGETAEQSIRREVLEEGNVEIGADIALHGLFHNRLASRRDHVAVYVCRVARNHGPKRPDREIAGAAFFAIESLPDEATPATRRRLDEWRSGARPSPYW